MNPAFVAYRGPTAQVQFIGETTITVEPSQLVSVQTRKSLAEPAGSFDILLKTGTDAASKRFVAGPGGQAPVSQDYWMEKIRPMMVCWISFGSRGELATVEAYAGKNDLENEPGPTRFQPQPDDVIAQRRGTPQDTVRRNLVMIGVVDEVTTYTSVGGESVERGVRISGRDMTRFLLSDTLRRVVNTDDASMIVTVGEVDTSVRDLLVRRTEIRTDTAAEWFNLAVYPQGSVHIPLQDFFDTVLQKGPSLQTILPNNRRATEYLSDRANIDPRLQNYVSMFQAPMAMFMFRGAPWQAMQQMAPKPFVECWVDTVGTRAYLTVRRPPFARGPGATKGFREIAQTMAEAANPSPEYGAMVALLADVDGVTAWDEFTEMPCAVVDGGYHTISGWEVMQSVFARSAGEAITMFQSIDGIITAGGNAPPGEFDVAPVLYDVAGASRYGTHVMQVLLPWGYDDRRNMSVWNSPAGGPVNLETGNRTVFRKYEVDETNKALSIVETVRSYYFYRDNPEYLSGSLTVRGRPEIRVGDRVRLPEAGDLIFYVESVEQVFQVGQPYITRMGLSRGQPFRLTHRLAKYDSDPPVAIGQPRAVKLSWAPQETTTVTKWVRHSRRLGGDTAIPVEVVVPRDGRR
jgi:hypothetical protein